MKKTGRKATRRREGARGGGGLSVTERLTLLISGAIAVFTLVFGFVITNMVSSQMSRQIDEAGVLAARALAVSAFEGFGKYAGTEFQGQERKYAKQDPSMPRERFIVDLNLERLGTFIKDQRTLLDAVILTADKKAIYAGRAPITFDPKGSGTEQLDVTIVRGIYRQNNQKIGVRARLYETKVSRYDGTLGGWAVIALSEERIGERLSEVVTYVSILAVIFLALGAGASYLLGRKFTTPIRGLIQDVEIVAKGNLDHRTRSHSRDEIGRLAMTFDQMTRNLKTAQDAERDLLAQKHQMGVAMEIQENLLPKNLPQPQGVEIEALHRAGTDGSGDFYDVLDFADDSPGIMIASSSGTGIPAAMLTTMVRSFLIATSSTMDSPAELLKRINRLLSPDLRRGLYVTALLARVEDEGRALVLANAGHSPLVCWRAQTGKVELIHSEGIALGFDKGPIFDKTMSEVRIELGHGDRVVFCTPGLFTMTDSEGNALGENRFYGLVSKLADRDSRAFLDAAVRTLEKFQGMSSEQESEDRAAITMATLKRQ